MKKILLLLCALLGSVGSFVAKATVITDASQLSNTKVYTIKCERGFLVLNKDQTMLVSSHKSGMGSVNDNAATDDASKQFGIIKIDGSYYIYSPKLQKFGRLENQNFVFHADRGTALTFQTDGTNGLEGSNLRFFAQPFNYCMNNNNSGGIVTNSYTTAEGGNTFTFYEVDGESLDENEVMAVFNAPSPQFDAHKVYKIKNYRNTAWTANSSGTGITGVAAYPGATEQEQEFAFMKYNGKFYLYNVGAGKFIAQNGSLTDNKIDLASIEFRKVNHVKEEVTYPYMFYIVENNHFFNAQNGSGFAIDGWNTEDDGDCHRVEEVDVDVYDDMLAFFERPSWDVTYNIYYNEELVGSVTQEMLKDAPAALPSSWNLSTCSYTYEPSTITSGVTSVNVTATWNGPFILAANYASISKWYDMSVRDTWYVTSDNKAGDGALKTVNANAMGLATDAYQWAFVGDPYHVQLYNKAEGSSKVYTWTSKDNASIPAFVDASSENYWWIKKSTASANGKDYSNAFMLTIPENGYQVNQFGGEGGSLKIWNSDGTGDAGSAFKVFDVPANFADFTGYIESVMTSEATGYFTLKDAAKSLWNDEYKTTCTYEKYVELQGAIDNDDNWNLPVTGCYRLKNINYNKYMGLKATTVNGYNAEADINGPVTIVQLTKGTGANAGKYSIQLQGKYLQGLSQSNDVPLDDDTPAWFTPAYPTIGTVTFSTTPESSYTFIHCASGGNIVGWTKDADASKWILEDATTIKVAISDAGYATLCVPFAVTIPSGVKAYAVESITNKILDFYEFDAKIPAGVPVILEGNADTYTFNITSSDIYEGANKLVGNYTESSAPENTYVLQKQGDDVGFYQVVSEPKFINANRAYLDASDAGVKAFFLNGGDTDAIKSVFSAIAEGKIFDLSGRKVAKMQKGKTYIVNGKKVNVK